MGRRDTQALGEGATADRMVQFYVRYFDETRSISSNLAGRVFLKFEPARRQLEVVYARVVKFTRPDLAQVINR